MIISIIKLSKKCFKWKTFHFSSHLNSKVILNKPTFRARHILGHQNLYGNRFHRNHALAEKEIKIYLQKCGDTPAKHPASKYYHKYITSLAGLLGSITHVAPPKNNAKSHKHKSHQ